MIRLLLIPLIILGFFSENAVADGAFSSSMDNSLAIIKTFTDKLPEIIQSVTTGDAFSRMVLNSFVFFSLLAIIFAVRDYIFGSAYAASLAGIISTFTSIAIVYALIQAYVPMLAAIKGWTLGIGAEVQAGILGKSDPLYPLYYMYEVATRVNFHWGEPDSILSTASWVLSNLFMMILGLILALLNVAMFLVNVIAGLWSIWGFSILAFVGQLLVPLILSPQLSFLFDGWLRIILMTLLFGAFARISTALSILGYSLLLGIPAVGGFAGKYWILTLDDFLDIIALIVWSLMSIYGIKASFLFAQAVVSGMGGGISAPGSLQAALRTASK